MNIREIAIDVLDEVLNNNAYSNIVLDKALNNKSISQIDKNFITKVVHGVLQNFYLLDYKISLLNNRKIKRKIYLILLISIYQLDYMDKIPEYAVINEAIKLSKMYVDNYAAKFVNAILRNYVNERIEIKKEDFIDKDKYLSIYYSFPLFIIKMLSKQYGEDLLIKILEASLKNAPLSVRVNISKVTKEELLTKGSFIKGTLADNGLVYIGKTRDVLNEYMKKGLISIQDEAGQLVAPLLELKESDLVLDMCAAPGSKTCHMGEILDNKGQIIAIDLYEHRLELLQNALNRLGLTNISLKSYDSTKLHEIYNEKSFNKILLDAPCSGLGVIRRKMEIKYNVKPETIDELVELQSKLLDEAYLLLQENGILVYSTCTINKKENEKQIDKFIKKYPNMKIVEQRTILPSEYDSDGFYYCKMLKEG